MSDIYKPNGCSVLSDIPADPQIRVGFQGPPGVGKTTAALTFPNPIVLNIDRGLGAHGHRSDVIEVPFWNPKFVDSIVPRSGANCPPNRRDALLKWLKTEGMKLSPTQTLILDSNTQIQNAYHAEYNVNPVIAKSGKVDDFAEWKYKLTFYDELMMWLKTIPCNVVYICHETPDRDKTGELNGMVRPLLTGQFADQLASHMTDWFRCLAFAKPTSDKLPKFKELFKLTDQQVTEWLKTGADQTVYVWQTQCDERAMSVKTSTLFNAPKYILADYSSLNKYKRKVNDTNKPNS